jgi:hypothetical protein
MNQNRYHTNLSKVTVSLIPTISFKDTPSTRPLNPSNTSDSVYISSGSHRGSHRVRKLICHNKWKIIILVILIALIFIFGVYKCIYGVNEETQHTESEANMEKFPWLVKVAVNNGSMDIHCCTGFIISGKLSASNKNR